MDDAKAEETIIEIQTTDCQTFQISKPLLEKSTYFSALLTDRWNGEAKYTIRIDRHSEIVKRLMDILVYEEIDIVECPEALKGRLLKDCEYFGIPFIKAGRHDVCTCDEARNYYLEMWDCCEAVKSDRGVLEHSEDCEEPQFYDSWLCKYCYNKIAKDVHEKDLSDDVLELLAKTVRKC